jgi:hemoglobin/transferrin/lactoferrin receptor protein
MLRPRIRFLVPTLCVWAAVQAAEGQPAASDAPSDELVVTATRLGIDPFEQPYALHQIDREALQEANARTMIDAIDRAPGVIIQRTAGNQASPYIRGLTGQQTLLMFDGVRLNHALFRSGPNQYAAMIPDEAVDRVDVILGTGTTVLGSDGLTGAIDFRLAEAGRGREEAASAWAKGRYGSADGGGGAAGIDGRLGDWAYSLEGAYASFGELQGGSRAGDRLFGDAAGQDSIPNTDYEQYSLGGRVAYLGIDGQRFDLAAGHVEQTSAERPDGYFENSDNIAAVSRYYDPQTFDYVHLRHAASDLGPWDATRATLWYHKHRENQIREDIQNATSMATRRYRRREYDDAVTTLGADLQLTNRLADHEITYGATAYRDRITSEYESFRTAAGSIDPATALPYQNGEDNPELTTVPDRSRFTGIAGFAQDLWRIAEQWSVLGGARYDRVSWVLPITPARSGYADYPAGDFSSDADAVTGNMRVAWQPTEPWMTWAGIGQGFRTPTASDLSGTQDRASSSSSGLGPQTEGNPELKPEYSTTIEWGAKFESDADSFSLSLFHTRLKDLIQTVYIDVDGDGTISNLPAATNPDRAVRQNASKAVLQGGEVACDLGLPVHLPAHWHLSVFQVTSLVDGESYVPQPDGSSDWQHISRANTLTGKAGAKLADAGRWYVLGQVRWADGYDEPAPGDSGDVRMTVAGSADGSMPGFAVVDVKAGVSAPDGDWRFDVSVENIGNITYRQFGSGTDGSGLNLVAGGQIRF